MWVERPFSPRQIIKFMKDSVMGSKGGFDFTVLNKIFNSTGAQDIAMSSLEQFDTVDFIRFINMELFVSEPSSQQAQL